MHNFNKKKEYDEARRHILTCSAGDYAASQGKTPKDYTLIYISEHAAKTYTPKHTTGDKRNAEEDKFIGELERDIMCALYSKMRKERFDAVTDYRYESNARTVGSTSMPIDYIIIAYGTGLKPN